LAQILALDRGRRTRSRSRLWQRFWLYCAVALIVMAGGAVLLTPRVAATRDTLSAQFVACGAGARLQCVVDGDTFYHDGVKIRIADIDTPEVHDYGCVAEKALGDRATVRLMSLLNAGPFALEAGSRDADRYGRKLRVVRREGHSLGEILIAEGLARRWDGARHPWC
jgi:micrococcal nuclease